MGWQKEKIGKQGTWPQALLTFFLPLLLLFVFRWFLFEPFVIPSESMVPNLLTHDHILVKKFSYGLKPPIGDGWLWKYSEPKRGQVIVFRFPDNRDVFFVKRLIGLPGDEITVQNGQISVNGKPWALTALEEDQFEDEDFFNYYFEQGPGMKPHRIRLFTKYEHIGPEERKITVPPHSYFVMGDNRDQSHDSRFWGFVDENLLVGQAALIWMSCKETLVSAPFICDPLTLRGPRFLKSIE